MAATGKTPILLYGSTTATNVPVAGNLTNSSDGCEIAINVADKNLFFKDSTNTVNTVPIRQSSASSNGWLSSTDWNTFNSKQPAGTYVTSVTGTAPVVSSGGTTPAISMAAASGSVNGYLTSTDWTTFNNKVSSQWTTSGSDIYYTSGNVGVGTTLSAWTTSFGIKALDIGARGSLMGAADTNLIDNAYFNASNQWIYKASAGATKYTQISGAHTWHTAPSGTAGNAITFTQAMTLFNSGGVSIGNTTDPGATNLSVTGLTSAARFVPTGSTVPTNGLYLPASNVVSIATNSTARLRVNTGVSIGNTTDPGVGALRLNGSYVNEGAYTSTYHIDTTPANVSIANNGTLDISSFSGMVMVNNLTSGGVAVWLCGGGGTTQIGTTGATVNGTLTYNSGVSGYRFTNTSGATATFGFVIIRTRNGA